MKNLPTEIRAFLKNSDSPEARSQIRLFLPPLADGWFLNFIAFSFSSIFAFGLWAGIYAVVTKEKIAGNKGALFVMLLFAALFTWAAIYAWAGLRIKSVKADTARPQFGYWVLQSGILARNRVREIVYLPWDKITTIKEVKIYQKSSESQYYSVYPTLRIRFEENGAAMHYNFSGDSRTSVLADKVDTAYVNLYRYEIERQGKGEFLMFKNACSDFKPF